MKNQDSSGSGGGAAVAVVLVGVLLAVPCLVAVLLGAYLVLGVSRQAVVVTTPTAPVPTAVKLASPVRVASVTIGADEALTLDGAAVELDELPDRLRQLRAAEFNNGSSLSVAVHCDAETHFAAVQRVLTTISETGLPYTLQTATPGPVGAGMPGVALGEAAADLPAVDSDVAAGSSETEASAEESSESEASPAESPETEDETTDAAKADDSAAAAPAADDASAKTPP